MKERLKKAFSVSPLKITFCIIILAIILLFLDVPSLRFMKLKALDLRMLSRGRVATGGETVIAVIDEKSLSELGQWPWPRTTIAKLVASLKAAGAKAVGFDIVFAAPDANSSLKTIAELNREAANLGLRNARLTGFLNEKKKLADTDAALAGMVKKARNVTLGYFFHTSGKEISHLTEKDIAAEAENISGSRYQMVKIMAKPDEFSLVHALAAVTNLLPLSKVAENSGYFNAFPDTDGTIRWSPLVIKFRDNYYRSLGRRVYHDQ